MSEVSLMSMCDRGISNLISTRPLLLLTRRTLGLNLPSPSPPLRLLRIMLSALLLRELEVEARTMVVDRPTDLDGLRGASVGIADAEAAGKFAALAAAGLGGVRGGGADGRGGGEAGGGDGGRDAGVGECGAAA